MLLNSGIFFFFSLFLLNFIVILYFLLLNYINIDILLQYISEIKNKTFYHQFFFYHILFKILLLNCFFLISFLLILFISIFFLFFSFFLFSLIYQIFLIYLNQNQNQPILNYNYSILKFIKKNKKIIIIITHSF